MRLVFFTVMLIACADNQSRCEQATLQINSAREACELEPIDEIGACFAYADLNETDCGAYFACEADRYTCEDGQLLQSLDACPPCE